MHYYLAKTDYGNFRITYPDKSFLRGLKYLDEEQETEIFDFCDGSSGRIKYSNTLGPFTKLEFRTADEDIYRYSIEITQTRKIVCKVYQDNGTTVLFINNLQPELPLSFLSEAEDDIFSPYCQIIYSDHCLSLLLFKLNEDFTESSLIVSMGALINVNQDYGYFSEKRINHSYLFIGATFFDSVIANYFSARKRMDFLQNSTYAEYPLICEDLSLKPKSTWLSDLVLFDGRAQIGYPYIGQIDSSLKISLSSSIKVLKTLEIVPVDGDHYIPLPIFYNKKRIYMKTDV